MQLHDSVDKLNVLWNKVEKLARGTPFKSKECPLSVQRYGYEMRLCFNDRPIVECKAVEKIEAVAYLDQFVTLLNETNVLLTEQAEQAVMVLETWLKTQEGKRHD